MVGPQNAESFSPNHNKMLLFVASDSFFTLTNLLFCIFFFFPLSLHIYKTLLMCIYVCVYIFCFLGLAASASFIFFPTLFFFFVTEFCGGTV